MTNVIKCDKGKRIFSLQEVCGLSVYSQFCKENLHFSVTKHKEKIAELQSGLNINILTFGRRQTTHLVFTSHLFLCIFLYLEVAHVLLLHRLIPAVQQGSCSEAKLSLDSLERAKGGGVVRGLTLLFRVLPSYQMVTRWQMSNSN